MCIDLIVIYDIPALSCVYLIITTNYLIIVK